MREVVIKKNSIRIGDKYVNKWCALFMIDGVEINKMFYGLDLESPVESVIEYINQEKFTIKIEQ